MDRETQTVDRTESPAKGAASVSLRAIADLPGPRGLPLLGNLLQIEITRFHTILSRWADAFGPVYRFRIANREALVISDTELINVVLRDRPEGYRRRKSLQAMMLELGVDGVFNAEGLDWRRQRKLAMHAMNTEHLREFFGRLEQVTARLQRRWERAAATGARVDAQRDLMRFTVDVTSGLAFGTDLNTLEQEGDALQTHLERVFPALARRLLAPFPYWRWLKLPADRALDRAMAEVHKLVNGLIADARERVRVGAERESAPAKFLDAMVAAQGDDMDAFTDDEIVGNTLTMLLGGEDTTANTLAWMMHLMSIHPGVQAEMQAEADRVLGTAERPADYASTEALRVIESAAHEAMRLEPVVPVLALETNRDSVLGGVRLPEGTPIYLLFSHPAMADENFADPTAFKPERWIAAAGRSMPGHNTRAFLPFGAGPRFCPGRHLAMLEIKMVTAMLCRNFQVAPAAGSLPPEELFAFTMMPRNLYVTLKRRANLP